MKQLNSIVISKEILWKKCLKCSPQVAKSETMTFDKNPESVNSLDVRETYLILNITGVVPENLGKAVSSGVICFNFGKSSPSGQQMVCRSSQGQGFLQMCHVKLRVYSLQFGGTNVGQQYLIGAFLARLKRVFLEVSFPVGEVSRLQSLLLMSSYPWSTLSRLG